MLRHGVGLLLPMPWGTWLVNVIGSLVLGYLSVRGLGVPVRLFLAVGLCGGFTTYSTFNMETLGMLQQGQWAAAAANVVLTLLICLVAGGLGVALGQQ